MCSVYSVCIMSPTHNLSSKIGSERRGKLFTNGNSQSSAICASVMPNVYALCGICTSRAVSSAQIHLLWRTCMHSVAFVPPEQCHLHRYICYEECVCTLWHLYLQSYDISTDTYVMKNVYALCGICTSRAMTSSQIHMLWRTCMHFVAFVPPELWHLHRYICYEERVCTLWHLYLQSCIICTDTSVMKNMYSMHSVAFVPPDLYHLNRYVICTEHIYSHYAEFMRSVASVPSELCHMFSTEYICHAERMLYVHCSPSYRCHEGFICCSENGDK